MLFSQFYDVPTETPPEWFDPIMDHDTKLFIDPFLIFKSDFGVFKGAHNELIEFFNLAYTLAAETRGKTNNLAYKKLLAMLKFPEPKEFCLGYTSKSTAGSGTGQGFARFMAAAILQAISLGMEHPTHFEEIGLLHEGIGCDRISDITLNILKHRFVKYTQNICKKINVSIQKLPCINYEFDTHFMRWQSIAPDLPLNPTNGEPIILTPKAFLRTLPTIEPEDFFEYIWDAKNDDMRNEFNYEIKERISKKDIIKIARKKRFWVRDYLQYQEGHAAPIPYDLERDAKGIYKWARAASNFASASPVSLFANNENEFAACIKTIIEQFKLFVEENAGYKLLWDERQSKAKPEEAAQLLFLGVAKSYCRANNIDISREADLGKGPVDFKFSQGYKNRVLLEVKKAGNTRFWHGLEKQLPSYLKSEGATRGYYLVIVSSKKDAEKLRGIGQVVEKIKR